MSTQVHDERNADLLLIAAAAAALLLANGAWASAAVANDGDQARADEIFSVDRAR